MVAQHISIPCTLSRTPNRPVQSAGISNAGEGLRNIEEASARPVGNIGTSQCALIHPVSVLCSSVHRAYCHCSDLLRPVQTCTGFDAGELERLTDLGVISLNPVMCCRPEWEMGGRRYSGDSMLDGVDLNRLGTVKVLVIRAGCG